VIDAGEICRAIPIGTGTGQFEGEDSQVEVIVEHNRCNWCVRARTRIRDESYRDIGKRVSEGVCLRPSDTGK
jgi:hypothetical protein